MTLRERLSKLAEEWARSGEPRPQSGSAKPYPPSYHLARKEDAATLLAALRASEDAPAPASPRPEEPGRCVALDGMPGCSQPPVPGTRLCWAHGGDLVASPRAQPEAPRCPECDAERLTGCLKIPEVHHTHAKRCEACATAEQINRENPGSSFRCDRHGAPPRGAQGGGCVDDGRCPHGGVVCGDDACRAGKSRGAQGGEGR